MPNRFARWSDPRTRSSWSKLSHAVNTTDDGRAGHGPHGAPALLASHFGEPVGACSLVVTLDDLLGRVCRPEAEWEALPVSPVSRVPLRRGSASGAMQKVLRTFKSWMRSETPGTPEPSGDSPQGSAGAGAVQPRGDSVLVGGVGSLKASIQVRKLSP